MPRFRARFVGRSGRRSVVTIDAIDLASLSEEIERRRMAFVVDIQRLESKGTALERTRIPAPMLLAALDSLELMLVSGVRINMALRKIAEFAPAGAARRLWTEIARRVEEDGRFGESLRQFPRVFSKSMVGMIVAHESAGRLSEGVRHVRDYAAHMRDIRRESLRGVAYPALVFVIGLITTAILCVFTLPRFSKMLRETGVTRTNHLTAFFFWLSDFVLCHPFCTVGALLLPALIIWLLLRPGFRPCADRLMLRVPIVRGAVEALSMARICITYRALSESGIRVLEALEACAVVAGNCVYSRGILQVVSAVRDNATVGEGFERADAFAPEVVLAVKSGEAALPQVFGRLAGYFESEARHRIALALGMIEPVMLVFVLIWVFGVALAVVLPVLEVVNEIR